eukprot:scaffold75740_cov36-Tisochrysis_lutea.AAC.3
MGRRRLNSLGRCAMIVNFARACAAPELKALIISYGFIIDSEEWRRCAYTTNARSLYHTYYECVFFTARRQQADPASASACA